MREILDTGRAHLARDGAAALSLRAVARDLGMVSSAVYRYVPNRDALLTMLIIDAYDSLGAAVERTEGAVPRDDYPARFLAICHAVRTWAVAHPQEYALIYGSPVPGYVAPTDTIAPATPGAGRAHHHHRRAVRGRAGARPASGRRRRPRCPGPRHGLRRRAGHPRSHAARPGHLGRAPRRRSPSSCSVTCTTSSPPAPAPAARTSTTRCVGSPPTSGCRATDGPGRRGAGRVRQP